MGLDLIKLHDLALERGHDFVAEVRDDQWGHSTPCDDWNVRQLVNHVVEGNLWAGELARGKTIEQVGDRLEGDLLSLDPLAAYDASAEAAAEAFYAPGALDAPCYVSYGPVPGSVYLGHRLIDVTVHGWDLAVGTGQGSLLDPDLVMACWMVLEPQLEQLQASGAFGQPVETHADADLQTRLLAALGRRA